MVSSAMTEITLCIILFFLLLHNFSIQKSFLLHLKELENTLAGIKTETDVESPNEIEHNNYRDIADVPPTEIIK